MFREPRFFVLVIFYEVSSDSHCNNKTDDDCSGNNTGPSALSPCLCVFITFGQSHADTSPLSVKRTVYLGMMIVVRQVVQESIDHFHLTICERVVMVLLASFGQTKPHATHTNQMGDV